MELKDTGATVIDMRGHVDPQRCFAACHSSWAYAKEIESPDGTIPEHAAFGTCPFPSANLDPRPNGPMDIRKRLHGPAIQVLAQVHRGDTIKAIQCLDLLAHRVAAPGFEGSHRDEAPGAPPNAEVYGGWYNMGPEETTFTYCPGTHKGQSGSGGFAPLSQEDHERYKDHMTTIVVPVGFLLLFNEKLVHMVPSKKPKGGMNMRLFMGFVVGPDVIGPINDDIEWALDNTGNFPRKSGQLAESYPKLWWTNWFNKIEGLTNIVKPELHEYGHRKGTPVVSVYRFINKRGGYLLDNPHPPVPQAVKDIFLVPTRLNEGGGDEDESENEVVEIQPQTPAPKRRRVIESHWGKPGNPIVL